MKNNKITFVSALSILLTTFALYSCIEEPIEISVSSIKLSEETLSLTIGDEYQLTADVYPTNATNKKHSWYSDNIYVATVDDTGRITAIKEGNAQISVITEDGGKIDYCDVIVNKKADIRVENVKLSTQTLSIAIGEKCQLVAEITPSNATNKKVNWSSNNIYVATVDETGIVTGVKEGNVKIYVTTEDGGKIDFCEVTVTKNAGTRVESIKLSNQSLSITIGEDYQLSAEITPSNATNKKINWSSNNINVATVDESGKVTGIKDGYARITATTEDGGKIDFCEVTVTKNADMTYDLTASGTKDGYGYVDLGLSVKWATHNIGTNTIEGIGEYYAWGESEPYNSELTYINYGWSHSPCSPDAVLASIYDTATEKWGKSWRMPTAEEMKELIKECDWTWIDNINNTSTSGYIATSKRNGKSIFLPASKFMSSTSEEPLENDGIYWSASTHTVAGKLNFQAGSTAECLKFVTNTGFTTSVEMNVLQMGNGATIRPVVGTPNDYYPDPDDIRIDEAETQKQGFTVSGEIGGYTYVDLGFPSRTLWATYNVGADMPYEYGDYFAWGETSPKDYYIDETYVFFEGFSDGKESRTQLSKYVWDKDYGKTDGKFKLENEDDAAYVNWGRNWCMPTVEQVQELAELCDFWRKDITVNGKKIIGYVGKSKLNGNRIYLPAAGSEYSNVPNSHLTMWYWTSEISRRITTWACLFVYRDETGLIECLDGTARWEGLPVRPVVKK